MFLLVTNNQLCFQKYKKTIRVDFLEEGSYLDVLIKVRNYVQSGYRLETHPLAGSIKPNQTPYRTVLLSDGSLDEKEQTEHELMIEDAVLMTRQFLLKKPLPLWAEDILDDFRLVDLDLIGSAIDTVVR